MGVLPAYDASLTGDSRVMLDGRHRLQPDSQPQASHRKTYMRFIPLVGRYAYHGDDLVELTVTNGLPTYRPLSRHELDEIDRAIQAGTIEIEARTSFASDEHVATYHQATGRALTPVVAKRK